MHKKVVDEYKTSLSMNSEIVLICQQIHIQPRNKTV